MRAAQSQPGPLQRETLPASPEDPPGSSRPPSLPLRLPSAISASSTVICLMRFVLVDSSSFLFPFLCVSMLHVLMRLGILSLRASLLCFLLPCPPYTKGLTSNPKLERAWRLQTSFPMFEEDPVHLLISLGF